MIRRAGLLAATVADFLFGQRGDMLPPRHLRDVGPGDFTRIGEEFLAYFRNICDLTPSERVLDVGCGIGRMALPLTRYLDSDGSYDGFDIVPSSIRWCQRNITPRFPSFRFQLADIHNTRYNPGGGLTATSYRFPYADESFSFVFLTSVFTHMMPDEIERYLQEIRRVLTPDGRMLSTFFLLTSESRELLDAGSSSIDFSHDLGTHRVRDAKVPESAIAYEDRWVQESFSRNRLRIREPVQWGSWCGRSRFMSYQDVVIADRATAENPRG